MPDALAFRVDLTGNLGKELGSSAVAAGGAESAVEGLTSAINGLAAASAKKPTGSFFTFDLAKGAEMAFDAVSAVVGKVIELGEHIGRVASRTQDLNLAIKLNVGDAGAKQIETLAEGFKDTRFGPELIKQKLLPLLEVGMKDPSHLHDIVTAATDIAARTNDPGAMDTVLDSFKRIHTKREVNSRMLLGVGVNEKDFYAALGETIGRSAKGAEAQVKAGKVTAEQLEAELLGQIAKREGGSLGKGTDASVKTLGTTLARLERLPDDIFKQVADSPGLKLMQDRADAFIDKMSGPAGLKIVEALGGAIDKIGAALFGDGDAADVLITAITEGIPKAINFMGDLWNAAKGVASALGAIVDAFREAGAAIDKYQDNLNGTAARVHLGNGKSVSISDDEKSEMLKGGGIGWFERQMSTHRTLNRLTAGYDFTAQDKWVEEKVRARVAGQNIAQGHADGIASGQPIVEQASKDLASCAVTAVDDKLQIHSPSRVMMERGEYTAEGMAIGLDSGSSRVEAAARRSLADSVAGTGGAPAGGGASSITIAPTLNYHAAPGDGPEQRAAAMNFFRVELSRFVDEARARTSGAAGVPA